MSDAENEAIRIVEAFHKKFGANKRLAITKDGKLEIVPASPEEMSNYERVKSAIEDIHVTIEDIQIGDMLIVESRGGDTFEARVTLNGREIIATNFGHFTWNKKELRFFSSDKTLWVVGVKRVFPILL